LSDIFLLFAFIIFFYFVYEESVTVFNFYVFIEGLYNYQLLKLGSLCLFISISIKSVQFLGHLWLPDSMEAPIPASALIHSATLVMAGIILLIKFGFLFSIFELNYYVFKVGVFSYVCGNFFALYQTDIKKILAYSTMSNCGIIVSMISMGQIYFSLLYLVIHGVLKAASFFSIGSFILNYRTQDIRYMGNGSYYFRLETFLLFICLMNFLSFPATIGYVLKEIMLNNFFFKFYDFFDFGCLLLGFGCTVGYVLRVYYYIAYEYFKSFYKLSRGYMLNNNVIYNKCFWNVCSYILSIVMLLIVGFFFVYCYYFFFEFYFFKLFEYNFYKEFLFVDYIYASNYVVVYFIFLMFIYLSFIFFVYLLRICISF
jgi:NADH-quinone oxidoreductase subunit L